MSFQKEYENYLVHSGIISEEELAHYGVPGMKWGVRKSTYKKLNRNQKRALKAYAQAGALNAGTYTKFSKLKGTPKASRSKSRLKLQAKVKARLEKAIGEKINDESAKSNARASMIMRQVLGGIPLNAATTGIRERRFARLGNMDQSFVNDYLKNKKKK